MPTVSVVIPAFNASDHLRQCLMSLKNSISPPSEIIVVDDGSSDDVVPAALEHGATVFSTGRRSGASRARNIGALAATGDILLFVDADVCVHPGTIGDMIAEFTADPDVDAVIGSYDLKPKEQNFTSQYRNLMHSYVHHKARRQACTFWTGCGAVRRAAFLDMGGFNEKYTSASIEDIEFGNRLYFAGYKLVMNSAIQATHLKRWTVPNMIRTDVFLRAIPWSALVLRTGKMPNDLGLQITQRLSVAIAYLLLFFGVYLTWHWKALFLAPVGTTVFLLMAAYWLEDSLKRSPVVQALVIVALALIALLLHSVHLPRIFALTVLASSALIFRKVVLNGFFWLRRVSSWVLVASFLSIIVLVWAPATSGLLPIAFLSLCVILGCLNAPFYIFLARQRGIFFAFAAVPFHWVYFLYSGMGFGVSYVNHQIQPNAEPDSPAKTLKVRAAGDAQ